MENRTFKLNSITDLIKESVSVTFESIMMEEIDRIKHQAQENLDKFTEEQKKKARDTANNMAIELLRRMDHEGLSLEIRI